MSDTADSAGSGDHDVHVFDNGVRVYLHHISEVQSARYRTTNLHEPVEEEWFRHLSQSGRGAFRFADIGAGIGYYAILLKRLRPCAEAFCFEPLQTHAENLVANLRLNDLDREAVSVLGLAVCDRVGREAFHEDSFGSRLAPDCPHTSSVATTTLEAIVESISGPLDLVKVDVQGDERRVIAGAGRALKQIGAWVLGTHSLELHRQCLADFREGGLAILFEDPAPPGQPDGLIVAVWPPRDP